MVKRPEISIVMNCHNGERFLAEAIDSVFKTDFQKLGINFLEQ